MAVIISSIKCHSDHQIVNILKQAEQGIPVAELCREHDISQSTFYHWRSKYGSMGASLIARLKELEVENACLKKIYAEERLKSNIRQDAMTKKWERSLDAKHWLITISKSKIRRAVQLYYATTDI